MTLAPEAVTPSSVAPTHVVRPFTITVSWSPALGYQYQLVLNNGQAWGDYPHLESLLDQLFADLYTLGHGNRAHHEVPTP